MLNTNTIPSSLRDRPQWVCWKYVLREGKQTKCPFNAKFGVAASSTDPATWSSFDEAVAAWQAGGYEGVGFVFAADDPFCGVDLDECINGAGIIVPAAREIIDSLSSYSEVSPSGRGVKIFIEGRKPVWAGCRSKAIAGFKETEVYDHDRFFTVTAQHLPGTPRSVEGRQAELEALCQRLWPQSDPGPARDVVAPDGFEGDDDALLAKARSAANGGKFSQLFAGDTSGHGGDESAADLALCNLLGFWTGNNPNRMDRLFRRSGLMRPKWDARRGDRTYGQMTVATAIEGCREAYASSRKPPPENGATAGGGNVDFDDSDGSPVPLGQRDPGSGRLVLSARKTLPTAEAYVREFHTHDEGTTLVSYGGELLEWADNRYRPIEEGAVKHRLQSWLHGALRCITNRNTGEVKLVGFESNPNTVTQALETIKSRVHLPESVPTPSWRDGGGGRMPVLEVLPCKSKNLHIPTGEVLASTPALFTRNALDIDYEPDPEPPERWIRFLEQVFGDDLESVGLLQEWMGYCLTADTSQQKMLLIVGPKRSGKGTIGRVLTQLVGEGNVVGPTTGSLAGQFGMQPLLGKSLAIVSDARFGGDNLGIVTERLLCISGEDRVTVERKFLGALTRKLSTRFVFLTNELPRFNDSSTALAGRFLVLRLQKSFYGQEDPTLTDHLLIELPGILGWAIDGWRRLRARGKFEQPKSGEESVRDMEDLASPVGAFVRDECEVGTDHRVYVDTLYTAWTAWCLREGRSIVSTKQTFGRDLMAAFAGITRHRGTGDVTFYRGIRLAQGGEG